jgi:MoxR-like ATPase
MGYPSEEEELQMLQRQLEPTQVQDFEAWLSLEDVTKLQSLCSQVKVTKELQQYIINLVRASRHDDEITLGVSPRGTVALQKASQAFAFLEGRDYAIPDDVKFLAPNILSHRLIPAGGRNAMAIVSRLLRSVPVEV